MKNRIGLAGVFVILICMSVTCAKTYDKESDTVIKSLSIEQKIGQMIMPAVPGKEFNNETARLLQEFMPGGVILFAYNLGTKEKISLFIQKMQNEAMKTCGVPLFISIDQEGGRVKRIREGVTQFPGNMAAGAAGEPELVYQWARVLGMQLRRIGINMNLAPVLDVNNNPDNPVINSRSFGSGPRAVAELGASYIRGLQESSCIALGKHFPGHGDTNRDSHLVLPVITYGMDRLREVELYPFREAIDNGVEAVMSAHIAYPAVLGNNDSATISSFFLTSLLRKEMGFKGLIITDDMEMNAISREHEMGDAAVRSVLAGADIVLISSYGDTVPVIYNALRDAVKKGRIPEQRINDSVKRIIQTKLRYNMAAYKDASLITASQNFNESELLLLKEADRINTEISRKAIYYSGDYSLISGKDRKKIAVFSDNPVITKVLGKDPSRFIVKKRASFTAATLRHMNHITAAALFDDASDPAGLKKTAVAAQSLPVPFILMSGGNPFPVVRSGLFENILFSFSNTAESVKQMCLCLAGDFEPKKNIAIDLGFTEKKQ